jgi:hypothetical protein
VSFGTEAHIRVARQDSANAPVSATTSFHSIPFVSETMAVGIPDVISDTIRARYDPGPSVQGLLQAGGEITCRVHPISIGLFLYAICGQCSTSVSVSGFSHVIQPVDTRFYDEIALVPWTIEKYAGADEAHFFHDCNAARFMLEITPGAYMRSSVGWIARTHSAATKSTPSFPSGLEYTWNQASISIAGAGNILWETMALTIDNALDGIPALDGTVVNRRILRNGFRNIRISGMMDFPNNNEFDKFRAGSEQPVIVTITGPTGALASCGSGNPDRLRIDIPAFRYATFPVAVTGPNRVTVAFDGRAVYHVASAASIRFTVTNTLAVY